MGNSNDGLDATLVYAQVKSILNINFLMSDVLAFAQCIILSHLRDSNGTWPDCQMHNRNASKCKGKTNMAWRDAASLSDIPSTCF